MPLLRLIAAFGLALAATAAPAAPQRDWTRTVALTPEGGHLVGNAGARTRLVEYLSFTCPHCAHFVGEASAPLRTGWIGRGTLAIELRNLVRDRYDLAAALIARCGGAARFPGNVEAIFAAQPRWFEKIRAYEAAPSPLPADASRAVVLTDIAERTGLVALMATRGVTPAQSRACLADGRSLDTVMAMTKRAVEVDKATGTPAFLVDGRLVDAHDWAGLRPLLPPPAK